MIGPIWPNDVRIRDGCLLATVQAKIIRKITLSGKEIVGPDHCMLCCPFNLGPAGLYRFHHFESVAALFPIVFGAIFHWAIKLAWRQLVGNLRHNMRQNAFLE